MTSESLTNGLHRLVRAYESMVEAGPLPGLDATTFQAVAAWYLSNSRPEAAATVLTVAFTQHPLCAELHLLQARLLLHNPRHCAPGEAMPNILAALAYAETTCADHLLPMLFRVEAYCRRHDYIAAARLLDAWQADLSTDVPTLPRATYGMEFKDCAERLDALQTLALREPDNPAVFHKIWLCIEMAGCYREGINLHLELLERHPYCSHAWHNLGLCYLQRRRWEDALESFEYAFIANPYLEEAYVEYATLACEQGHFRSALYCCEEQERHLGADSDLYSRMGECERMLGNTHIARTLQQQALHLDPYHADACYQLGLCFATEGDLAQALKWLRQAIRYDAEREAYHAALALVYQQLGQVEKALRHGWQAATIAPDEPAGWSALAYTLYMAGRLDEAIEVLDRAGEHADCPNFRYYRVACLLRAGARTEGFVVLRNALILFYEEHEVLFAWAPELRKSRVVRRLLKELQGQ